MNVEYSEFRRKIKVAGREKTAATTRCDAAGVYCRFQIASEHEMHLRKETRRHLRTFRGLERGGTPLRRFWALAASTDVCPISGA